MQKRADGGSGALKRPASADGDSAEAGAEAKRLRLSDSEKLHAESIALRGAPAVTTPGVATGAAEGGPGEPVPAATGPGPLMPGPELAPVNPDVSVIFTGFGTDDVSFLKKDYLIQHLRQGNKKARGCWRRNTRKSRIETKKSAQPSHNIFRRFNTIHCSLLFLFE